MSVCGVGAKQVCELRVYVLRANVSGYCRYWRSGYICVGVSIMGQGTVMPAVGMGLRHQVPSDRARGSAACTGAASSRRLRRLVRAVPSIRFACTRARAHRLRVSSCKGMVCRNMPESSPSSATWDAHNSSRPQQCIEYPYLILVVRRSALLRCSGRVQRARQSTMSRQHCAAGASCRKRDPKYAGLDP